MISGDNQYKVIDLVMKMFELSGLDAVYTGDQIVEKNSQTPIVKIDVKLGTDFQPTNIRGNAQKLKQLGWRPKMQIDGILKSLERP